MSRTQRTDTIRALLEARSYTYQELLDHFERNDDPISERTLKRDVGYLRDIYRPLWDQQPDGKQQRFRIKKGNVAATDALVPFQLGRFLQQLHNLPGEDVAAATTLLKSAYPSVARDVVMPLKDIPFIELGEFKGNDINLTILEHIVSAIQQRQLIRFAYRGQNHQELLPLRLLEYKGRLYVVVWSVKEQRYEPYRMDGVSDVLTHSKAAPVKFFDFDEFMETRFGLWEGKPPMKHHVIVEITPEKTARNFRDRQWHPTQVMTDLPNGGLRIEMHCGLSPELTSWILHWTPHIRVIQPTDLRDSVRELYRKGLTEMGE